MELSNQSSQTPEQDTEKFQETYNHLLDIYEIRDEYLIQPRTFAGFLLRKQAFGREISGTVDNFDREEFPKYKIIDVLATTQHIRSALNILKDEAGVDILNDKHALTKPGVYEATLMLLRSKRGTDSGLGKTDIDRFPYSFALDIANLFGGNKAGYRQGIAFTEEMLETTDGVNAQLIGTSQLGFYKSAVANISNARYEAHKQLRALSEDDVTAFVDYGEYEFNKLRGNRSNPENAASILQSQKQELDFTILPVGTSLVEVAEEIIQESSEKEKQHIDLKRLTVLEAVRKQIGVDKCYLMRGKTTGKGIVDTDGTLISEDYIGLIMQYHDDDGKVVREDCLAISPIGKKHAGYIVRQDASAGLSWREILSLPKQDAIEFFNARRLRFDQVAGRDKYEAYTDKVMALLRCEPEKFTREYVLSQSTNGYRMVHRGKPLGSLSLQAALS